MSEDTGSGRFMTRGLGQVLFNYLPDATLDYDRGSCICKVAEVRAEPVDEIDPRRILSEIGAYVGRWEGRVKGLPDTRHPELFFFGIPQEVLFNVYPLVFECKSCRVAVSFPNEQQYLSGTENRHCRWCGGKLIQIYHVLVHECGHLKSLWVPRCNRHGNAPSRVILDFRGSQKARDFRWVCRDCGAELRPINRICDWCRPGEESEEKSGEATTGPVPMMRAIPHRANAAYYAHHITLLNVDTQDVAELLNHPERERILVEAYLRDSYSTEELLQGVRTDRDPDLVKADDLRRRASAMPEGAGRDSLLQAAETLEALVRGPTSTTLPGSTPYGLGEDAFKDLFEYVKLRGTCRITGIREAREAVELVRPGQGAMFDLVEQTYRDFKIAEVKLVQNFPIFTAVFGYTRVGFEPESALGETKIRTTFNAFPSLRMSKESLVDRVPIFINKTETEALLIRLDPIQLVEWINRRLPGSVTAIPKDERDARLWLLRNVGGVDRFVTQTGMSEVTKAVFGVIHTLSHVFIRAAALLGGIERTGLGEYLFPRLGALLVYNANTVFNLGGLTTLFEDSLLQLVETGTSDPLARECVYDPVCSEHWGGSCHACTHVGEMACSFFNRGMSRSNVYGSGMLPGIWTQ